MNIQSKNVLIPMLLIASACNAESQYISIDKYRSDQSNESMRAASQVYITGVGIGYSFANVMLERKNGGKLYCPPEKLPMTGNSYNDILKSAVAGGTYSGDTPAELVLFNALVEMFPCKSP
jgi:hypothetical protein